MDGRYEEAGVDVKSFPNGNFLVPNDWDQEAYEDEYGQVVFM